MWRQSTNVHQSPGVTQRVLKLMPSVMLKCAYGGSGAHPMMSPPVRHSTHAGAHSRPGSHTQP
jgi:hypothetical protein